MRSGTKPKKKRPKPESKNKIRVIGLTGGIASGKSTAAKFFVKNGILVVDADQIARELSSPDGEAYPLLVETFGTADRAELRKVIFSNPEAKKKLESILHPLIQKRSMKTMLAMGVPMLLYEAALLVETGRYKELDALIVVQASRENRLRRLIERNKISPELAEKMLASQASDQDRSRVATYLIQNDGSLQSLEGEVKKIATQLKKLYKLPQAK